MPTNELSSQLSVFTLYSGSQNILWIGTDGQGLIQLYHYDSLFETVHTSHPVRCFCEDEDGNILIGTKGSGIKLLNPATKELTDYLNESKGLISNSVYALRRNKANDIFIGTEGNGINILNVATGRLEKLEIPINIRLSRLCITFILRTMILFYGWEHRGYGLIKINISREQGRYHVKGFRAI